EPLYLLMHQRLLLSRVIHGDDTSVKLRVAGAERTSKAHLWVGIGDADYPYVVFDFTADYTAAGPERFLNGYRGYLQADALAQYEGLYGNDRIKHVCCWAHARRKFVAASENKDERAEVALGLIRRLYAVERDLPPLLVPDDDPAGIEQRRLREEQRRDLRRRQAEPFLTELKGGLDEQPPQAVPKSPLGQAIGYALNNWEALERFLEQGYLAIDNNLSERTLRAIALGRNNWGVIGSETGGRTAAMLYTVVGTCKHLGIDPFTYLKETLPGLFALGEKPTAERLSEWLPDRWLLRRARAAPPTASEAGGARAAPPTAASPWGSTASRGRTPLAHRPIRSRVTRRLLTAYTPRGSLVCRMKERRNSSSCRSRSSSAVMVARNRSRSDGEQLGSRPYLMYPQMPSAGLSFGA